MTLTSCRPLSPLSLNLVKKNLNLRGGEVNMLTVNDLYRTEILIWWLQPLQQNVPRHFNDTANLEVQHLIHFLFNLPYIISKYNTTNEHDDIIT